MAGVRIHGWERQATAVAALLGTALVSLVFAVGCGGGGDRAEFRGAPSVTVTFRGDPLAGVRVSLSDGPGGPPLAQAVTGDDGRAYFTDVPSPEPQRYRVGLEALGDGGWMLDRNVIDPFCEAETLDPLEQSPSQELALPERAVRPLDPVITR